MLDLESFARLQAQLRRPFAGREDVLRRVNLDDDGLIVENVHWSALLAASEATALRQKYREAYARAIAAEAAPDRASSSPATAPLTTPASPRLDSTPPEAPGKPTEAPRRYVASFMQAPLGSAPSGPTAAHAITPSSPMPRVPAVMELMPAPRSLVQDALQHAPKPALQHAAPLVPPSPIAPPVQSLAMPPTGQAPGVAMPPRAPLAQRGTSPVDLGRLRSILNAGPTPFAGKTTPEQLEKLRESGPKSEPIAASARGKNATMMGKLDDGMPGKTLPFAKNGAGDAFPDLTVDRYAALAAELQAKGPTPTVLARYEIGSAAALVALSAEHARRFAADPQLRARFEERKAHFLAFMAPPR